MLDPVLRFSDRICAAPVIHGSGDSALEVRRILLDHTFDCIALPLPPSFQSDVEHAVGALPSPTIVCQHERPSYEPTRQFDQDYDDDQDDDQERTVSYVPIDPCQPVIAAVRVAIGEHIPRAFIDLETSQFRHYTDVLPDAYALKKVSLERFASAMLPSLGRPPAGQARDRINHMAARLRQLESHYDSILLVCSVLDWPWLRDRYNEQALATAEHDLVEETSIFQPDPRTLIFVLGELPFITGLYERARKELEDDSNLAIDGIKELLLTARNQYKAEMRGRARKITPQMLNCCIKYIRNLTLLDRRLTPDFYTVVTAAKQVVGDGYAIQVAEDGRAYADVESTGHPLVSMGVDSMRMPDGEIVKTVNRLPGPTIVWRSCQLRRRPDKTERDRWAMQWNPFSQCSWPPEDRLIESFRTRVAERAKAIAGTDLVRTEKFTTSIRDGIDIRETIRNWHTGDLYVKIQPPSRGNLDAVVMLFESPADPRDYPWRTTWFAEHQNESTLAFFATNFQKELVGPGIGMATYGGALFLFPPVSIHDIWLDPRLDYTETLEERLLAAACQHSQCRHIALMSTHPPGAGWRRLARRFKKKWIHVPLAGFSDSTIQRLRMVHVLNGRQVRSYADHFIRKS